MIITLKELNSIRAQREKGSFPLEVDFGTRVVSVKTERDHAVLDGNYSICLRERLKDNFCYLLKKDGPREIAFFSKNTNRFYKLLPTEDWPTVTISSVPMHRISLVSPKESTYKKISIAKPCGVVLDTCMGLGYTAIAASKSSDKVYTFELDKNVYTLAKLNPVSQDLFKRKNIEIKQRDVSIYIKKFDSVFFDCIIHDPPTFKISPTLYSTSFYKELYRALKPRGRFFHYTPFYGIKRGINFPLRIKNKLKETGFKIISFVPDEGGILCRR